jgi:hypothetical protein
MSNTEQEDTQEYGITISGIFNLSDPSDKTNYALTANGWKLDILSEERTCDLG